MFVLASCGSKNAIVESTTTTTINLRKNNIINNNVSLITSGKYMKENKPDFYAIIDSEKSTLTWHDEKLTTEMPPYPYIIIETNVIEVHPVSIYGEPLDESTYNTIGFKLYENKICFYAIVHENEPEYYYYLVVEK